MIETWTVCSDMHIAPPDDPRCDTTAGWAREWKAVERPKMIVGDGLELAQFSIQTLWRQAQEQFLSWLDCTAVLGNHDAAASGVKELEVGDSLFLHGHQFDPWLIRLIEPLAMKIGNVLEKRWADVDVKLLGCLKRLTRTGREAKDQYRDYVVKAARYARERGASQVVFGHLHCPPFGCKHLGVCVVNSGCCVNGSLDFVPIYVEVD